MSYRPEISDDGIFRPEPRPIQLTVHSEGKTSEILIPADATDEDIGAYVLRLMRGGQDELPNVH